MPLSHPSRFRHILEYKMAFGYLQRASNTNFYNFSVLNSKYDLSSFTIWPLKLFIQHQHRLPFFLVFLSLFFVILLLLSSVLMLLHVIIKNIKCGLK